MNHHRKKLRILVGKLKDKASIVKATLSKRNTRIHKAVLRATTHNLSMPPSDKHIAAVLSLGNGTRQTACSCIGVLMDRLNSTKNASVALKCLFTIHAVITRGSFILKDQLSYHSSFGGRNFLNLSKFSDFSDTETWELSSWDRWYAAVLEHNLKVSRVLRSSESNISKDKEDKVFSLLQEMDVLVDFVQQIIDAPESLHLQKINLIYEVVRLVSEDYRSVQQQIFLRASELGDRMVSLRFNELSRLSGCLKRFKDCKDRLRLLIVNRARHDALWELISKTKMKITEMIIEKKDMKSLVKMSELTRFREQSAETGQLVRVKSNGDWLVLNQFPLTVYNYV